jgi:transcription termination factor Rho
MTAEQQLERSVLERKERDELLAIAQALSVKTTTRTKKADMIDGILRATGVELGEAPETVHSPRANGRKAKAPAEQADGSVAGSSASVVDGAPPNGSAASVVDGAPPNGSAASVVDGAPPNGSAASVVDGAPSNGSEPARTAKPPAVFVFDPEDEVRAEEARSAGGTAGGSTATSDTGGAGVSSPPAPRHAGTGNRQNGTGQNGTGQNGTGQNGTGQNGTGQNGTGQAGRNQGNRQGGQGQAGRNQGNQGNRQGGQSSLPDDAGNRRGNRRRRGRDRQGGGERDLQDAGQADQYQGDLIPVRGFLDLRDEGYGFLRCDGYLPSAKDVYVSISQARRFALRRGDVVEGACRPAGSSEKYPALLRIDTVAGLDPEAARNRPRFEELTPLFPDEKLRLELPGDKDNMTARIVDLLSPIGKGQRGLIVSPPKAGKTTVMKQIAHSIEANNPDVHLMVLLVDERPEEVTDMRRSVRGEVVASTFDRPSEEHTTVAELAIERAKRLVELGRDVIIILDGITRLARAYNLAQPATGRIMSGGVDSGALYPPKKFFGAARNIEEGGSLTILATALVETGSKMDEVIFEEFKGTGNMELRLDRRLAERRLYPSIDVNASSTRHEELLFDRSQLQQVWKLRRVLNALASEGSAAAGLELLMDKIRTTASNDEFLAEIAKGPSA